MCHYKKKINPIIIGEIIFPRNRPNLNQILFNGFKILEFNKPRTKKIIEINKDHFLYPGYLELGK